LISSFLILGLVKTAEGIDIARTCDPREAALTLASNLEFTLNLFDHHLLQREDIGLSHGLTTLIGLASGPGDNLIVFVSIQVNKIGLSGA